MKDDDNWGCKKSRAQRQTGGKVVKGVIDEEARLSGPKRK